MDKQSLSERDICTKFITPALRTAGWDEMLQIREEVSFTKGRIIVRGKLVTRGKAKRADYILYYKPNIPIAIVEAKDNTHSVGDGMQQALDYAETLNIPFVFSSNGDGFLFHDRTGTSNPREAGVALDAFPSPAELWRSILCVEGFDAGSRRDRRSGVFRRRQRKSPTLLSGQCHQRHDRGHRQRPGPPPVGHGHRHGQDLHGLPDHLAALEGTAQKAHSFPRRPKRPHRPNDGQRLPPFWRGNGQAVHSVQNDRKSRRNRSRSAARRR